MADKKQGNGKNSEKMSKKPLKRQNNEETIESQGSEKKRAKNWRSSELIHLVDAVISNQQVLFGEFDQKDSTLRTKNDIWMDLANEITL